MYLQGKEREENKMEGNYYVVDAQYNFICIECHEAVALKIAEAIGGDVIPIEN
jgi:hypothetical protein